MWRIFGFLLNLLLAFFLLACASFSGKNPINEPDALSYQAYLDDLASLRSGKRSFDTRFGFNKDIGLIYYDWSDLSTRIAIVVDRRLNQQYIFIYSEYSELNQDLAASANTENIIGLKSAKISGLYMDLYIKINDSIANKVQPSYGKIVIIGFGTGGGLANILALDLSINSKIPNEKLEVVTFGQEPFSRNLSPGFSSRNILLDNDKLAMEAKKCCNFMDRTIIIKPQSGAENKDRIFAYKQALAKFIAQ